MYRQDHYHINLIQSDLGVCYFTKLPNPPKATINKMKNTGFIVFCNFSPTFDTR